MSVICILPPQIKVEPKEWQWCWVNKNTLKKWIKGIIFLVSEITKVRESCGFLGASQQASSAMELPRQLQDFRHDCFICYIWRWPQGISIERFIEDAAISQVKLWCILIKFWLSLVPDYVKFGVRCIGMNDSSPMSKTYCWHLLCERCMSIQRMSISCTSWRRKQRRRKRIIRSICRLQSTF